MLLTALLSMAWVGVPGRLLIGSLAYAVQTKRPVSLFDKSGRQVENYNQLISKIKKNGGDILELSGREYKILKYLGEGYTTIVFLTEGNKAIRLPLRSGKFKLPGTGQRPVPYTEFINFYLEGYNQLKDSGIAIPRVYEEESRRGQYLIVEAYDIVFSLEYLLKPLNSAEFNRNKSLYLNRLLAFAKKTASFSQISDFKPDQLGWDARLRDWILLDYSHAVLMAGHIFDSTVFDSKDWINVPKTLRGQLRAAVIDQRKSVRNMRFTPRSLMPLIGGKYIPNDFFEGKSAPAFSPNDWTPRRCLGPLGDI